jgi:NitT/TauT family transport system ATP-binding protein
MTWMTTTRGSQATTPGTSAELALEVVGLTKSYGDRPVVRGLNLRVERGSFVAIVGPSGCGKTTLLEMLGGLRRPDRGSVRVDGVEVTGPTDRVGFVFQEESTLPWRTVADNVRLPLELLGRKHARARAADVDQILELVQLTDARDKYPAQLSGGMRQRVAIARLLVTRPDVFLLDEPFGALDEQLRVTLGLELRKIIRSAGATGVLITHSIQESVLLADRIVVLSTHPATVVADLVVDITQDRDIEAVADPRIAQLSGQIWAALRTPA